MVDAFDAAAGAAAFVKANPWIAAAAMLAVSAACFKTGKRLPGLAALGSALLSLFLWV